MHSAIGRPAAGTAGVPACPVSYDGLGLTQQAGTPAVPAAGRLLASVVLVLHVVIFVVAEVSSGQTRPPRRPTSGRPVAIDYTKFSQHQATSR